MWCQQLRVVSLKRVDCQVWLPQAVAADVGRWFNLSLSQDLDAFLTFPPTASTRGVAVDTVFVHVLATAERITGCVNGSSSGCVRGDQLMLTGAHFTYAPQLLSAALTWSGPQRQGLPTYPVNHLCVVNDSTLLVTVPQTGGEQQLTVVVTIDDASSPYAPV